VWASRMAGGGTQLHHHPNLQTPSQLEVLEAGRKEVVSIPLHTPGTQSSGLRPHSVQGQVRDSQPRKNRMAGALLP
jgi:hypothetical protein